MDSLPISSRRAGPELPFPAIIIYRESRTMSAMRWLLMLLLLPYMATASELEITLQLSSTGLVQQHVTLSAGEQYDSVEFTTQYMPVHVDYDGDYSIRPEEDYFVLSFPAEPNLTFTLIHDGFIERRFSQRLFRMTIIPQQTESVVLSVVLPRHFALSERKPSAVPRPDAITTDGKRITLTWHLNGTSDISVFYESSRSYGHIMFGFLAVILAACAAVYWKKRADSRVRLTLSGDEQAVLSMLRHEKRQDRIAKKLGYSKSKMSKLVRRLEEKSIVTKKAHFKTNILKKK